MAVLVICFHSLNPFLNGLHFKMVGLAWPEQMPNTHLLWNERLKKIVFAAAVYFETRSLLRL